MDDEAYRTAFQIILHAGNSRSNSMMALQKAREGDLEEAQRLVIQAEQDLNEAHLVQTDLIQAEANGLKTDLNLIMVHAQDHLGMATVMKDVANELLYFYRTFGTGSNGRAAR